MLSLWCKGVFTPARWHVVLVCTCVRHLASHVMFTASDRYKIS